MTTHHCCCRCQEEKEREETGPEADAGRTGFVVSFGMLGKHERVLIVA